MSFLSLPGAQILHTQGWGQRVGPNTRFRVEFASEGKLMVFRKTMLGEKPALWLGIVPLQLQTWTDTIHTGGGFFGGGFGVEGAAKGVLEASVLNALTSRRREYTLLGAFTYVPDGSRRDVVFGFRGISESSLREELAAAVPRWAEDFVERLISKINEPTTPEEVAATYTELDGMKGRGMLTDEQHVRLEAELLKQGPRPAASSAEGSENTDRVARLKTLSELRKSGDLSDAEFQAEKARIIDS